MTHLCQFSINSPPKTSSNNSAPNLRILHDHKIFSKGGEELQEAHAIQDALHALPLPKQWTKQQEICKHRQRAWGPPPFCNHQPMLPYLWECRLCQTLHKAHLVISSIYDRSRLHCGSNGWMGGALGWPISLAGLFLGKLRPGWPHSRKGYSYHLGRRTGSWSTSLPLSSSEILWGCLS